jgi:glycosyltransferase involved in cell wall biosynthesis
MKFLSEQRSESMIEKNNEYCIIIPAYNAAQSLSYMIDEIHQREPDLNVIVVNDGSTDHTLQSLKNFPHLLVVNHSVNRGKGAALKSGIAAAKSAGYKYAFTIDADQQHSPLHLRAFIHAQQEYGCAFVLGKRTFDCQKMPFHRILSNKITSFMISIRVGKRIRDSQCGYRLFRLNQFQVTNYHCDRFQFESELLLRDSSRLTFCEVSIDTRYNKTGSHISNIKDTLRFVKLYLQSFFWI